MPAHRNLTGSDLHEPKGIASATSGQVYVADGSGSGTWTNAVDLLTAAAWRTGDIKIAMDNSTEAGWIPLNGGTIGDASSGSSTRANADTEDLFTVIWNLTSNTSCPVFTSAGVASTRGASAAADYAAHKRIRLPLTISRNIGLVSYNVASSEGLTTRGLGELVGAETHTLTASQIPHLTATGTTQTLGGASFVSTDGSLLLYQTGGNNNVVPQNSGLGSLTVSTTTNTTGGQAHTIMQPTVYFYGYIKL